MDKIEKALNKKATIINKITKNESFYTNANIEKAKKVLRYTPKTEFEDGIKQFINWYVNYTKIKKLKLE